MSTLFNGVGKAPSAQPASPNRAPAKRDPDAIPDMGMRSRLITAGVLSVLLVFGVGGWAVTATLSSAVIAGGDLVVDSSAKKVQHPTGGVVGELRVRNGDRVEAGDLLVRLDDTQTRASLGTVTSQLMQLYGRHARLTAERNEADAIVFPSELAILGPDTAQIQDGERRLFEARRKAREGEIAQLRERVGQLREQQTGQAAQLTAKEHSLELARQDLERVRGLYRQNLVPVTRVLTSERDQTQLSGERGALMADIARVKGQVTEIGLQILSVDQKARSEAQNELRDVEGKISDLAERRISAEDMLKRVELRAPVAGTIHELSVHTVGGVIGPGEAVMLIVPSGDPLAIEVRIAPQDIDNVTVGKTAIMRFTAFNQRTSPELKGRVVEVAPDLSRDPKTGQGFYLARLKLDDGELGKLNGAKLLPGMPVESFIGQSERTAMSYLTKPFTDQLNRALREK